MPEIPGPLVAVELVQTSDFGLSEVLIPDNAVTVKRLSSSSTSRSTRTIAKAGSFSIRLEISIEGVDLVRRQCGEVEGKLARPRDCVPKADVVVERRIPHRPVNPAAHKFGESLRRSRCAFRRHRLDLAANRDRYLERLLHDVP